MNKNKDACYFPCSNVCHLLGTHLVDGLGAYNYELGPNFLPSSIPHHLRGVVSFPSLEAKPACRVMLFCWTAHVHWRVTAGSQAAVVG